MGIHVLETERWQPYFEAVSRELGSKQVEIEVSGLGITDHVHDHWVPLQELSYDPKSDRMKITAGSVDHLVRHPREIYVEDDLEGLHSIRILDTEGQGEIIKLKKPMMMHLSQ